MKLFLVATTSVLTQAELPKKAYLLAGGNVESLESHGVDHDGDAKHVLVIKNVIAVDDTWGMADVEDWLNEDDSVVFYEPISGEGVKDALR